MHPLIPQRINLMLDQIVTKCFEGNRIADRGMSILAVKFAMNATEALLHQKLAHLFPQLADVVSSYQGDRNNLTIYGITPKNDADYDTPLQFFETMLIFMNELEDLVMTTIDISRMDDGVTYVFLEQFLRSLIPVTSQILLLVDKAEQYTDWALFDHHIEGFITL